MTEKTRRLDTLHGKASVLEPVPETWKWLDLITGPIDEDFVKAVNEQPELTERPALKELFR